MQVLAFQMDCQESTVWRTARLDERAGLSGLLAAPEHLVRPTRISLLLRAEIVALDCLEPVAKGLHITHRSSLDLARQAVADGMSKELRLALCVAFWTPSICTHQSQDASVVPKARCLISCTDYVRGH